MLHLVLPFFGLFPFLFPPVADAHAFGQLYNLPVPFWMYLYGGAAAIIFSFVVIASFSSQTSATVTYPTKNFPWFSSLSTRRIFISIAKSVSFLLFLFTIITGLFGEDYASVNFSMTFFWIWFVLGFSYSVSILGNVWDVINPWKIWIEWGEILLKTSEKGLFPYPKKNPYFPSLLFYILFICIELFGSTTPFTLSLLLLLYTGISLTAAFAWGKQQWFLYGDFFSVFFRLLGSMSFFSYTKKGITLRIPFTALVSEKPADSSLILFIIFMLSSTAFDGIHSTVSWVLTISSFPELFGGFSYDVYQILGLMVFLLCFFAVYMGSILLLQKITTSHHALSKLAGSFAYSLLPIAFVYNLAHYYTLLITEGQNMIRLISDPFGYGWDLFGTAGYFDIYIPPANFVWHSQVFLIVGGHIVGVYIAHMIALRLFPTQKKVFLSQIPLLLLMVFYTMIGLWILSQPLTPGN